MLLKIAPEIERGRMIPPKMADRPDIEVGWELYWGAYLDLCGDRSERGLIPWTIVTQWCDRYSLDPEQHAVLWGIVRELDQVFIEWKARNAPK